MAKSRYYRRYGGSRSGREKRTRDPIPVRSKVDPGLRPLLDQIGVPTPEPFRPDPFQTEALDLIQESDVLVTAPTGAGKTWIASEAIHRFLMKDQRIWYASPLKALSNSIYQDFCREFGPPYCGILTGDRKENPDAPIVVGTTEILRNQLYDAMHRGASIRTDLVVLDEAHYLSDPERGVVWEEVLIYMPPRVRLLLLSATISNPEEVCAWLGAIRGAPVQVVRAEVRPVPLKSLFLFPDGLFCALSSKKGLHPKVQKYLEEGGRPKRRSGPPPRYGQIIAWLRELNLLPAIFFLKSRADCDRALLACPSVAQPDEAKTVLRRTLRRFLKDYPHLKGHRQIRPLMDSLVAAHHGGQLPYWKVLIEQMMNLGLLEAIFATSTVAAGVNFPARTVVLLQSDRFNGHDFAPLSATDLHQMIGRAGRRGKDQIGFALIVPGAYQDPQLIGDLQKSPPEPLCSRIQINFSMTLNLLLSHTPVEVKPLLECSFGAYQGADNHPFDLEQWSRTHSRLMERLPEARCDVEDPRHILETRQRALHLIRVQAGLKGAMKKKRSPEQEEKWAATEKAFQALACAECPHVGSCHRSRRKEPRALLHFLLELEPLIRETGQGLWLSFKRHVRFLKETGFVDAADRLTSDGLWASNLRLDQPLLIAEAIRRGALDGISSQALAGALAPFVWDRVQNVDMRIRDPESLGEMAEVFERIMESIEDIRVLKEERGFSNPRILLWPAAALFLWAGGLSWEGLLEKVPITEGDMASLIMRTADHLRQVGALRETHPDLAGAAFQGVEMILREPVYL